VDKLQAGANGREGPARIVFALNQSIVDILLKRYYVVCELHNNTYKELAGIAHISIASQEEAGSKKLSFKISMGNSTGNR
jgi:hypothetical protein